MTTCLLVRNNQWKKGYRDFSSQLALSQRFFKLQTSQKSFKQGSENSELKSPKREYYHNFKYNCPDLCPNGANGWRC